MAEHAASVGTEVYLEPLNRFEATSVDEFRDRIGSIVLAVLASPLLAGFCYTQLTDTGQETNGLCDQNRVSKLPEETVRAMITGSHS